MCSAIQPSFLPRYEAMRSAKHFLPSSTFPPYAEFTEIIEFSSGKCRIYLFSASTLHFAWKPFTKSPWGPIASSTFLPTRVMMLIFRTT